MKVCFTEHILGSKLQNQIQNFICMALILL